MTGSTGTDEGGTSIDNQQLAFWLVCLIVNVDETR
jgi:hypothetical protein